MTNEQAITQSFFAPKPARDIEQFWDNQALLPGYQGVVVDTENNLSTQMLYNFISTQFNFKDEIILDVGCGVGRLFPVYLGFGVKEIHGVDLSMNMIRVARFKYPQENVYLYKLASNDMGTITTGKATIVITSSVLCHIIDDEILSTTTAEMNRICAIHGIIVMCEPMSINSDITHEHSMMRTRPTSLYKNLFAGESRASGKPYLKEIHCSRECFGQVDHIDSNRTVLVYRKTVDV